MKGIKLYLDTPFLLLLIIPLVLAVLVIYRRRRWKSNNMNYGRAVTVLRVMEVTLLVVISAGLHVLVLSEDVQTVLLLDRSGSMNHAATQVDVIQQTVNETLNRDTKIIEFAATPSADDPNGTDIAAALEAAMSLLQGENNRRMILVSDGVCTDGDALAMAKEIAAKGIRLDAVHMQPTIPSPQAELIAFDLPVQMMNGHYAEAAVTLCCDTEVAAILRIGDNENTIAEEHVLLHPGQQKISHILQAEGVGPHTFTAEIELA